MYGQKFAGEMDEPNRKEWGSFLSTLRAWVSVEHNEDGTHIPQPIRWLTGPWIVGGADSFGDPAYVRLSYPIPTGTYHNFGPAGIATAVILSIGATGGNLTFTGLLAPEVNTRRLMWFRNEDNTSSVTLMHQDAGSDEANRFRLPNNLDIVLTPNESVLLLYDTKWQRWSVMGMVR
jgi:hypothetical protein